MDAEHNCYPDCRCGNIRRPCHIEHGNTLAIEAERAQRWPSERSAGCISTHWRILLFLEADVGGLQMLASQYLSVAADVGSIDKRNPCLASLKTAGGWSRSPAFARFSLRRWLPKSATGRHSAQGAISLHGSDWCQSSIRRRGAARQHHNDLRSWQSKQLWFAPA